METAERVRELVAPVVTQANAELYDVEHSSGTLRIMIDRPGGIDVDTIGTVAHHISELLDESDPISGKYLLEVTSPGIERKLRLPAHFEAQTGNEISLKLRADVEGERRFNAQLDTADDEGITVSSLTGAAAPDKLTGAAAPAQRRIPYSDIESARLVFHWNNSDSASGSDSSTAAAQPTTNKKASGR